MESVLIPVYFIFFQSEKRYNKGHLLPGKKGNVDYNRVEPCSTDSFLCPDEKLICDPIWEKRAYRKLR